MNEKTLQIKNQTTQIKQFLKKKSLLQQMFI